jgi:hypothetical protein
LTSAAPDERIAVPGEPLSRAIENVLDRHWNACGQAAAASVLARFRRGAWAAAAPPDATAELDRLLAGFPPDVPFGLGTTAFRIAAALRANGVAAEVAHGGLGARAAPQVFERARSALASGGVVPVCVDDGWLGGMPWSAHWAVLLGIDEDGVRLGNCRVERLGFADFLRAWSCPQLPWTHNACAVLATAPPGDGPARR